MRICFPVQEYNGLESAVFNHFGSAPIFVVVDTESGTVSSVSNGDRHHSHGACNPTKAVGDQNIDAVIVGGIGAGALNKLNSIGIRVFRSSAATVSDNVRMYSEGALSEYAASHCCSGHGHGSGCSH
jgi:predicted Fe-Mo cluster-binding NifX family protein